MNKKITTILSGTIIIGGIVVGLQAPEPLTIDEMNVLYSIYNEEIAKNPVILKDVQRETLIRKLNEKLLKDTNIEAVIDGERLTVQEFNNLKRTLILKSERKTNFEQMVETIKKL
ncbi:hypothetical protein M0R04_09935 [Candidatus Dojkabacteria bacterium]|jgi:hypothetical protein|nr:hypothetical protein [Candidatus Dojkabacteria bacterium]